MEDRHDYPDWVVLNHQQKLAFTQLTHISSSIPFVVAPSPIIPWPYIALRCCHIALKLLQQIFFALQRDRIARVNGIEPTEDYHQTLELCRIFRLTIIVIIVLFSSVLSLSSALFARLADSCSLLNRTDNMAKKSRLNTGDKGPSK